MDPNNIDVKQKNTKIKKKTTIIHMVNYLILFLFLSQR